MKKFFVIIDRAVSQVETTIVALGTILIFLICFINVLTRYFIGWSWVGTEEGAKILLMWVTLLGTSWAARQEGYHISMSALVDATEKIFKTNMVKTFILQITYLFTGLFCLYLTFMGIQLTYFSFKGGQTTPGLLIPLWLMYVCFPIGIFLTGVHYLTIFFKHLLGQKSSPTPRELQTELQKEG